MKTYRVTGMCKIICGMTVKAEDEKEAIEKANEMFGGLSSYVGNGGTDKLLGVSDTSFNQWIAPDADPEFDECEEI